MSSTAYRATGRSEYPENQPNDEQDDAERPQDWNSRYEPDHHENQSKNNHTASGASTGERT